MNPRGLHTISTGGVIVSLFLCVWYVVKTYQAGNTRWYFLIMACGIAIMLAYGATANRKKRRNRKNRRK